MFDWHRSIGVIQNGPQSEDGRPVEGLISQIDERSSPVYWFASQDWYDPVEWHDGLGW